MKIYFAGDHAGFEMKKALMALVAELGHDVEDCGAYEKDEADDYPDFVASAARKLSNDVLNGQESRAIVTGASGQGEAMVANRFKGVRCSVYYGDPGREQTDMSGKQLDILTSSREHQNSNCLSLGLRFLTLEESKDAVKKWLETGFSGDERHVRRIEKLDRLGA